MEKDIIVLDHLPLLKSHNPVDGERIQRLSQKVDKMFRAMSRRRHALERIVKVKRIFNI